MKFVYDHDLHIHSWLSSCSNDLEQNNQRILRYAEENKLHTICLTDHFWDEGIEMERPSFYRRQNYEHCIKALPLPQSKDVRFLFGCETELSKCLTLGITIEKQELFDFIVIPTTHLHFKGFTISEEDCASTAERKAMLWVERLEAVLNMDLPFHKVGIAHLTCSLMAGGAGKEMHREILKHLPLTDMERLFRKAAKLGVGIELNAEDTCFFTGEEDDVYIRPYQIAKECNCKFYCGSDAHHPKEFNACPSLFKRAIDWLGLEEKDKFLLRDK